MAEAENFVLEGGCCCGEIRYGMASKPLFVHCCHCSYCQNQSGSAFAVNALVEASRVSLIKGQTETIDTPSPSGKGQKISRCPVCRVALWSNYAGAGDAIHFVRVGTLDNPEACRPDIHIYTSTRQSWVTLPADVPAVEEYYRARDHWPADSLERLKALKSAS